MADDVIRLSQMVSVLGPGAMLDLPERSVVVGGLDKDAPRGTSRTSNGAASCMPAVRPATRRCGLWRAEQAPTRGRPASLATAARR